jgi:hypothetical protein
MSLVGYSWDQPPREAGIDAAILGADLDAETRQRLAELGFRVDVQQDGQRRIVTLEMSDQDTADRDGVTENRQAKGAAITPEGYALDQNYPNPFNPAPTKWNGMPPRTGGS